MPLLDVSELLTDPDFADDILVLRSVRAVGSNGRVTDTPANYPTYGNVQQATDRDLQQLPDLERTGSFIAVTTPMQLFTLTDTTAADQIVWQTRTYRVVNTGDWDFYGNGYTRAVCQLVDLTTEGP